MFSFRLRSTEPTPAGSGPARPRQPSVRLGFDELEPRDLPSTLPVGQGPDAIAVADLGNGHPDIVVANAIDNTISVFLGKGNGTFLPPLTIPVGIDPVAVAVADLGNGHPDIIVANAGPMGLFQGSVSVLLGDGTGMFTSGPPLPVAGSPTALAIGDATGDNFLDIGTLNSTPSGKSYTLLPGLGNGTFGGAQSAPLGAYFRLLALGDFNNDGKLDIAATFDPGMLGVLLNDGSGFSSNPEYQRISAGPGGASYIGVGDFNRDGNEDLIFTDRSANTVSISFGNGKGAFQPPRSFSIGNGPDFAVVGDFNGDGKLDLITANSGNNTVSVALGNGDGTFQAPQNYPVGNDPVALALGDFAGNGKQDVAIVNFRANTLTILFGTGNGTFTSEDTTTEIVVPSPPAPPIAPQHAETAPRDVSNVEIARSPAVPPLPLAVPRTAGAPTNGENIAGENSDANYTPTLVDADPGQLDLPTERDVLNGMDVAESLFAGQRARARLIPQPGNSVSAIGALLQRPDEPNVPKIQPSGAEPPDVRPWLAHPLENTLLGRPGFLRNAIDAFFLRPEEAPAPVDPPVSSLAPAGSEPRDAAAGDRRPAWLLALVPVGLAAASALPTTEKRGGRRQIDRDERPPMG
jgi:hypothetical protein